MKQHVQSSGKLLLGGLLGYALFTLTSHPKSTVHQKLPHKRVKRVSLFPHIKIHGKEKHLHLHHWLNFSLMYAGVLAIKPLRRKSPFLHGLLLGSILQGLSYKDRFTFVYPSVSVE